MTFFLQSFPPGGVRGAAYQETFGIVLARRETGAAGSYREEALKALKETAEKKEACDREAAERDEKKLEGMQKQTEIQKARVKVQKGILARTGVRGGGGEITSYVEKDMAEGGE